MRDKAVFGPAGNSVSFSEMGYKHSLQVPEYIEKMGLDWFEYQCGRGVNIGEEKAIKLGELAKEKNIGLSVHAPYYISLASKEEQKRDNSIKYIYQSALAVDAMGGNRIVVHPGGLSGYSREEASKIALETLKRSQKYLDENGLENIHICPETMGKINQLGDLDEVLFFCRADERFLPCIDFGHLNARTHGSIVNKEDYEAIINKIENELGTFRAKNFHSHFSKIMYTDGGEKKHLTFEDSEYGPEFFPLAKVIAERKLTPVFVCESDGTQAEDALEMKKSYSDLLK